MTVTKILKEKEPLDPLLALVFEINCKHGCVTVVQMFSVSKISILSLLPSKRVYKGHYYFVLRVCATVVMTVTKMLKQKESLNTLLALVFEMYS